MERPPERFELVALAGGLHSLRSLANSQTFHPVVGPAAEAKTVHVGGTRLVERARAQQEGSFVVWDVGLGAAANALAAIDALRAAGDVGCDVTLLSFDRSTAALEFAIEHAADLDYTGEQRDWLETLLRDGRLSVPLANGRVHWTVCPGDFPARMAGEETLAAPHAIFYDPYSPAVNPEMWTLEVFTHLHARLRPGTPCVLTTYTRSTAVRVTLLLAGFHVGVGRSVGEKDETTTATNVPALLESPFDRRWVETKAYVSTNAAPLRIGAGLATPVDYSRNPISNEDFMRLSAHPQFAGG